MGVREALCCLYGEGSSEVKPDETASALYRLACAWAQRARCVGRWYNLARRVVLWVEVEDDFSATVVV